VSLNGAMGGTRVNFQSQRALQTVKEFKELSRGGVL